MTSNVCSELIMELENKEAIENRVNDALKSKFRPEFLNRIDEVIVFNRLKKEDIYKILDINIGILKGRLEAKAADLKLSAQAKEWLADRGYDPVYGARPLKRTIQKYVQDPISLRILSGEIKEKSRLAIDVGKNNALNFQVK